MVYIVYVLYSEKYEKIYIGYTSDLQDRLLSHNELATKGFTIKYRPWKLAYSEGYSSKKEAMTREKQLKGAKGRAFLWKLIRMKKAWNEDSYPPEADVSSSLAPAT